MLHRPSSYADQLPTTRGLRPLRIDGAIHLGQPMTELAAGSSGSTPRGVKKAEVEKADLSALHNLLLFQGSPVGNQSSFLTPAFREAA